MRYALLASLLLAAVGCDGFADDDFTAQVVVSANLGAEEPLPAIVLTESAPLLERYDPAALAVTGATVTVSLLAADGSVTTVYPYVASGTPGTYAPATPADVLPQRTYRLDVRAGDEVLTAETTVPPALALVEGPPAVSVYGAGQGPEVRINRTSTPARQTAFVISTRALAPVAFEEIVVEGDTKYRSRPAEGTFGLTPPYTRFLRCDPAEDGPGVVCDEDPRESATVGTSPVINEAGYVDLGDGTVLVQVPTLAFGFYGPVSIRLVSVDAALEAFVESQLVQGGGSTLSPGEIPNVTTNVAGGLGVFGSFARVTVETTLVE